MKQLKDLKQKSVEELAKLLGEKELALRQFRFDITGSKAKNVKAGRTIKKTIAQIKTLLRQKN